MEQLDLKIIKKRIQDLQRQTAADLEAVKNLARLQYDYRQSQIDNLLRLCDTASKSKNRSLSSKGLESKGA